MPQQLKAYIKTAEGRYTLVSDRPTNTSFNPSRVTRLTYASLPDGPEQGEYIIFNLLDSLHICRYNQTNKVLYWHSRRYLWPVWLQQLVQRSRLSP